MRWALSIIIGLVVWLIAIIVTIATMSLAAGRPGSFETTLITRIKYWRVGGKDMTNPTHNPGTVNEGADHFQHHCQICHGLDGQNTGVPIAARTLPPVADLASPRVQTKPYGGRRVALSWRRSCWPLGPRTDARTCSTYSTN